jgi:hypothetical protein
VSVNRIRALAPLKTVSTANLAGSTGDHPRGARRPWGERRAEPRADPCARASPRATASDNDRRRGAPRGLHRRPPTPPDDLMKWGQDPPTTQLLDRRDGPGEEGSDRAEVADNRRLSGTSSGCAGGRQVIHLCPCTLRSHDSMRPSPLTGSAWRPLRW